MIESRSKSWYKRIKLLKYFATTFLPLMIIIVLALFAVNSWQTEKNKQILVESEYSIGKINKLNIQSIFSSVTSDLKVIKYIFV